MRRVHIVEDESIAALYLESCLESLDYEVTGITDSKKSTLEAISENIPDLVFMDIMLGNNYDGIDTAKEIYEKYNIPIIFLTAYSDEKTLDIAKKTGAFGYLIKPVNENTLRTTIEMALEKYSQEKELKQKELWLNLSVNGFGKQIVTLDNNLNIKFINNELIKRLRIDDDNYKTKKLNDFFNLIDNSSNQKISEIILKNKNIIDQKAILFWHQAMLPINYSISTIKDNLDNQIGYMLYLELPNNETSSETELNISEVIKICSLCKKINNEQKFWQELEQFIQEKLGISFSHGVCPDCFENHLK